jgi:hypothetical protein
MTGYEEQLLTRAEMLEDAGDLTEAITAVLARAQLAGVDQDAVFSLGAAIRELDPGASIRYDAGSKEDRRQGSGYSSDGEFLEAVSEAEDTARERLREAEKLQEALAGATDDAQAALDAAHAMPVSEPCDRCHAARAVAIAGAERRAGLCEATAEILDPLAQRLQAALDRLRQVPEDLGDVYQLVYQFIRKGGKLPVYARWIEGESART